MDAANPLGGGKFRPYVKAIIEAERAPIRLIEGRKGKEGEKLKLLQEFNGRVKKLTDSVREISDYRKFREYKVDLGENGNLMGVELDKDQVAAGEYDFEIIQLAGRHSMLSNGFESPEDEIGVGYFWYSLPNGETKSIYLDSDHNTLKTVVDAINKESDLGLRASLVNDGSGDDAPWRIIVSSKKTGMNQDITYPEFYFVDGDVRFSADDERAAQSAIVKLNGFEILSPENKIKDLIPGAVLTLKQAKEGHEFSFNVTEDTVKVAGKIKGLVDNMNAVLDFINKQNQLDEKSDTSKTLGGDGTLRSIESQLRSFILSPVELLVNENDDTAVYMRASDLGIRFERSGQLSFNQETFQKRLTENFEEVSAFFSGKGGFSEKLNRLVGSLMGPEGILVQRERGFRDRMRRMDDQIAQKEQMISRKEDALKQKFGNLEATIQGMQGQQAYVQQALGSLAAAAG